MNCAQKKLSIWPINYLSRHPPEKGGGGGEKNRKMININNLKIKQTINSISMTPIDTVTVEAVQVSSGGQLGT